MSTCPKYLSSNLNCYSFSIRERVSNLVMSRYFLKMYKSWKGNAGYRNRMVEKALKSHSAHLDFFLGLDWLVFIAELKYLFWSYDASQQCHLRK